MRRVRAAAQRGPLRFSVVHRTEYDYSAPMTDGYTVAHLLPRETPFQRVESALIETDPAVDEDATQVDVFGNTVVRVGVHHPHERFVVTSRSVVEALPPPGAEQLQASTVTWEQAAAAVLDVRGDAALEVAPYAAITPRTRALLPVDVFGQPAPIEELGTLAERHGLALIQDACEAIGAERRGRRVGGQATAAVFAFYPNKQLTTGEGGAIVTNDADLARVARSLCNQGRDDNGTWMNHVRLGYNYRLDEMSAALGLSQVARLDQILDRRDRVAGWYAERLTGIDGVRPPYVAPETTRMSWFVYVVRLEEEVDRAELMAGLEEDGVPTRPYFVPIHLQPLYKERFGYRLGDFPVTEQVARTTLALPFFTDMDEDQVDYVCDRLARRLKHHAAATLAVAV